VNVTSRMCDRLWIMMFVESLATHLDGDLHLWEAVKNCHCRDSGVLWTVESSKSASKPCIVKEIIWRTELELLPDLVLIDLPSAFETAGE
jgi:hypothetical protein